MIILNQTKNIVLASDAIVADTLFSRMKGLLGKSGLEPGQALVLKPASSIHTFFMRFTMDAVFVDKDDSVIALYPDMPPFRLSGLHFNAKAVIELPAGVIRATSTQIGDTIRII